MEVQRIDHMHAWTDDVDRVAKLFRDVFGLTCDVYNFDQWDLRTVVVRVGQDRRFIEFMQPKNSNTELCKVIGPPRIPGVFAVNLKVANMDKAIDEMKSRGIKLILDSKIGNVRQVWFDTEKTFGVQIELSEYGENIFEEAQIPPPQPV